MTDTNLTRTDSQHLNQVFSTWLRAARQNAGLSEAIAGRCLLSLARKALALRQDR